MYFKPSRLEARVALNGDQYHELVARQRVSTTTEDPFAWLTSLFGGGNDDTSTTTTRPRTTTTTRATLTDLSPVVVPTNTRTSTTPTTTSQTRSTASIVTTQAPPPQIIPSQQFTTVTSTSSVDTGNTDASQANTNSTSKAGLPSVVVGIIVAASVVFGLIFIALIARKIFQSRRRNKRNTWATTGVTPFAVPITEKALPPPPPAENQAYPSVNYPAYPPIAVAGMTSYNPQPYSPAAAPSAGYPTPYPFGTSGNPQLLMQQNYNNTTTAASFTAADLAGPVVIQHTPPTPPYATAAVSVVKRTFVPSLPDELPINNGDQVRVISAYDDGWALCEKVSSGEKGVVPQECLEMAKQPSSGASATGSEESRLNRNSSLRHGPVQTQ